MEYRDKIKRIWKREPLMIAAAILVAVSAYWIPPDKEYIKYINWHVLALLASMMLVVAGIRDLGIFNLFGKLLINKGGNVRKLGAMLTFLCFFAAMFITNDVALITFVPLTIYTFKMAETIEGLCYIVILETVAANLGSMLLPMGNPQNLFLYSKSGLGVLAFIKHMIPWTALGAIILSFSILKLPSKRFPKVILESEKIDIKRTSVYVVLFLLCILAVFRVLNVYIVLLLSFLTVIFMDRKLIFSIDYSLLITFALFFIFVGNISRIHSLSSYISHAVLKNELILSISISQFISNMPTAILLSGFSNDYKTLLIGINLGGLGSLIASMASLISYQYISESHPDLKKKYIIDFTLFNIITLLIMIAIYFLFKI